MCLPTTFATDPRGSGTWDSPNGNESRIDYVAIPQHWLCFVQSARVDRNITLAIADKLDHRLVRVDSCQPRGTECVYHRPAKAAVPLPSRQLLQLPDKQALVPTNWQEVPPPLPGWAIDYQAGTLQNC